MLYEGDEKEEPNINSKTTKKLNKYDVINYEGVIENQFGKWIFYEDEYKGIKKYILAENKKSLKYVQHPVIENGIYIILPFGKNKAFTSNNSIISLQDISLNDNQKFLFRFNPEKRNYRINCLSSGKEFTFDSNSGKIKECDSGNGIRWLINTLNYTEFSLQDNQTKKSIQFIKNEEITLLNSDNNENNISLVLLDRYKNRYNEINEDEENEEYDNETDEEIKKDEININLSKNLEVQNLLQIKEQFKEKILKFSAPKKIITNYDLNEINKNNIKHIEIDLSIKAIQENIFCQFKNLESVYCHPKWINKFNSENKDIINIKEIFIKEGVTKIKKEYFKYCIKLNKIYIPKSIQQIQNDSFGSLLELEFNNIISDPKWYKKFPIDVENFKVPNNINILSREIFHNWKNLKSVDIHSNVEQLQISCFERCSKLKSIILPNNIKEIPENCFKNCHDLEYIKIPDSVIFIHPTAFIGCINLKNIDANERIKKLFTKKLIVPKNKNFLNGDDYKDIPNIETLEISLETKIDYKFFKNFEGLRVIKFDPYYFNFINKSQINCVIIPEGIKELNYMMFRKMKSLEMIEIPISVEKIENNTFSECLNIISVKSQTKWINYLNKKNLKSIIVLEGDLDIKSDIFVGCENLETVVIPDEYNIFENYLFRECRNLNIIKYYSGKKKHFKSLYQVPKDIKNIKAENYYLWTNVGTLIVDKNIEEIEDGFLMNCDLEVVQMNPKFLDRIPKSEIVCFIIPKFVKIIDEYDFKGCEKLKRIIILGDSEFKGNPCKEFEKIKILECNPNVLKNCKKNLRNKISVIKVLDESITMDSGCLKDFKNLEDITLPSSLKFIGSRCFYGCEKLKSIYLPLTIDIIYDDAFENCKNLSTVSLCSKFLKCLPKESICNIKILDNNKNIENLDFSGFKYLKRIEFPNGVEKVMNNNFRNCKNLKEIKCPKNLFQNLNKEDKINFQNVEIPDLEGKVPPNFFQNCPQLENINIPYRAQINQPSGIKNNSNQTSIDEIMEKDHNNLKYKPYLISILDGIKNDRNNINGNKGSLEEISHSIIEVCLKIKEYSKQKNKIMIPHPVQCITIIRICDEILNGAKKGAIAEVKTGEGKSFIIAVIAIVLVLHGRKVDVVTSNLELATRDQEDQKEYYNLFNIGSGVLMNLISDKNFISATSEISIDLTKYENNFGFNLDVFLKPIVYSTNYNYQFVYLHSLFHHENLRKREYDVVIVDEVDNMLLDQSSSPAIISSGIDIKYYSDIMQIIYYNRNKSAEEIIILLNMFFPKEISIEEGKINRLLKSANIASKHEEKVDYVISKEKEGNKEETKVLIIDHTTGYVKPGSRWSAGIHEFVEIKEKVQIKNPSVSTCSITQCTFFNMYSKITGLSGTLGNQRDQEILIESYGLNLFYVPRNLKSQVLIFHKPQKEKYSETMENVAYEAINFITKRRPVLIIFKYILEVEYFIKLLMLNGYYDRIMNKYGISTILGKEPKKDKEAIKIAGKFGHLTVATAAAGRGMDIKLDKISLENGGLHVILPSKMQNERVFWQCVGRCGRQGQPGSVTEYVNENEYYYMTPEFDKGYENLIRLQNKFSNFLRTKWSWLYDYNTPKGTNIKVPFGCSIDKFIEIYTGDIKGDPKEQPQILTGYYKDMILKAWGMFYSNLSNNKDNYSSYTEMEEEYENEFMKQLTTWIPEDCKSLQDANSSIGRERFKRIDWQEVALHALNIGEIFASLVCPGGPMIRLGISSVKSIITIIIKLLNGTPINWLEELLDLGLSIVDLKGKQILGTMGKLLKNGKVGKMGQIVLKGGNKVMKKLIHGVKEINDKMNNNKITKIVGKIGEGVLKDVIERRDEYAEKIGDIANDLAKGEIPTDKIKYMVYEGVYKGVSNASLDYINKNGLGRLFPSNNEDKKKQRIRMTKVFVDSIHDIVFKGDFIEKAALYNAYSAYKKPFEKYKDKKFEKSPILRTFVDLLQDNLDSSIEALLEKEKIMILPNGHFNDQVIEDTLKEFGKNTQRNIALGIARVIKKKKEQNEENRKKKELANKSMEQ